MLLMVVPYVVFTLIQNKDLRYVLPLTPVFAFYIAYTLLCLNVKFANILRGAYSVYLMFIFFFMSFNQFKMLPQNLKPLAYLIGGPYYHGWYYEPYSYAANPNDWRGNEIIQNIEARSKEDPLIAAQYKVLELSDNRYYSLASFEMYRRQNKFDQMEIIVPYFQFTPFTESELTDYIKNIQFALVPKDPGPTGLRNYAVLIQLRDYFLSGKDSDFKLVTTFEMPDGNVLSLFKRDNYITFENPDVRSDSLRISLGNILFVDRTKTGGLPFKVLLYNVNGDETVIDVSGGGSERRIKLDNIVRIRIDLPTDQQDIKELRGWLYENGEFTIDPNYKNVVNESGNEYVYYDFKITPRSQFKSVFDPESIVRYDPDKRAVLVSNEKSASGSKVFIAYATSGWQWNNKWLEGEDKYFEVPLDGLLQIEVSSSNQAIIRFPTDWGFFPCYEGKAICYYPYVENL
jgi:hypothetical protein